MILQNILEAREAEILKNSEKLDRLHTSQSINLENLKKQKQKEIRKKQKIREAKLARIMEHKQQIKEREDLVATKIQEKDHHAFSRVQDTFSKKELDAEELRLKNENRRAEAVKRRANKLQEEEGALLSLMFSKTMPTPGTTHKKTQQKELCSSVRAAKAKEAKAHFSRLQDEKMHEFQRKLDLKEERAQAYKEEKERLNHIVAEARRQEFKIQSKVHSIQERVYMGLSVHDSDLRDISTTIQAIKGTPVKKNTVPKCTPVEIDMGVDEQLYAPRRKYKCELCCNEFCDLRRGVSRSSVIERRKQFAQKWHDAGQASDEWDVDLEKQYKPAILYDQVKLCAFCFQFFA